jgi:hypothetical protein
MGGYEEIKMEGDIGGGLVLARDILLPQNSLSTTKISSSIVARSVGAGSGGFSRLVCLRIHPTFKIAHPMQSSIHYTAIDGKVHTLEPNVGFGELLIAGPDRPNGSSLTILFIILVWILLFYSVSVWNESLCYGKVIEYGVQKYEYVLRMRFCTIPEYNEYVPLTENDFFQVPPKLSLFDVFCLSFCTPLSNFRSRSMYICMYIYTDSLYLATLCYSFLVQVFTILIAMRPCAGEWKLLDSETGLGVVNRFDVNQVALCNVKWGPGSVSLELWSEERPVSKDTPLGISHEYELIDIHE